MPSFAPITTANETHHALQPTADGLRNPKTLVDTEAQDNLEAISCRALRTQIRRTGTVQAPIIAPIDSLEIKTMPGTVGEATAQHTQRLMQTDYELCRKVADGDTHARELFIAKYDRLLRRHADRVARQLINGSMDNEDLFQEARIYALEQAEKYQADRNMRFGRFLSTFIGQRLSRATYKQHSVRISELMQEKLDKIGELARLSTTPQQGTMTDNDIARELDLPLAGPAGSGPLTTGDIREARQLTEYMGSLEDRPISIEFGSPVRHDELDEQNTVRSIFGVEPAAADKAVMQEQLNTEVDKALKSLDPRHATIVRLRFGIIGGEPMTLSEIGTIYGLSKQRVEQIIHAALSKLRKPQGLDRLSPYYYHEEAA